MVGNHNFTKFMRGKGEGGGGVEKRFDAFVLIKTSWL